MREEEIAMLIDALRPFCGNLCDPELRLAAERFLDYLDLTVDFHWRHFSNTVLTDKPARGTVEEYPALETETNSSPS